MKQTNKQKIIASVLLFCVSILVVPWMYFFQTEPAQALPVFIIPRGAFAPFGGKIQKKSLQFCLKQVPPPIFILPIPFYYEEVGLPSPANFYWLFGISQLYLEYENEKTAWALGNYLVGASEAWREFCDINGSILPKAMGVAWKMGTSCKTDPKAITDDCHKRAIKREALGVGKLTGEIATLIAIQKILQSTLQKNFDASTEPDYCDPYSPKGSCYPKNTCDPSKSQAAGICTDSSGNPVGG